ncbi:hypothetical protein [Streptomyces sp. NPDC058861]|uniref:hypothetical protein n=1 Tax=Streptomyces sp. NPDC058861 TaxID=3346653 RepID=UPI0036C34254
MAESVFAVVARAVTESVVESRHVRLVNLVSYREIGKAVPDGSDERKGAQGYDMASHWFPLGFPGQVDQA